MSHTHAHTHACTHISPRGFLSSPCRHSLVTAPDLPGQSQDKWPGSGVPAWRTLTTRHQSLPPRLYLETSWRGACGLRPFALAVPLGVSPPSLHHTPATSLSWFRSQHGGRLLPKAVCILGPGGWGGGGQGPAWEVGWQGRGVGQRVCPGADAAHLCWRPG